MTSVKSKTREELIAEQHLSSASWSESELGPWADAKLQFSANVANFLDKENAASVEWSVILPRITCPGLLITADPSLGSRVTDTAAAGLNKLIPQLKVAHIPGAGHNIRREQFDRYLEVVRTFLANNMI
jgi:pimeloyl-ACP methyl ester carboxylesterase